MPKKRSYSRFIAFILVVACLAAAGYYFFLKPSAPQGGQSGGSGAMGGFAMPVDAVRVKAERLTRKITAVGTLTSQESVVLMPEVAGRVEMIYFEEGSQAEKGKILFTLDDALMRAELMQTEAQLKLASAERLRARKLRQGGAISQARLDQENADYAIALANAELSRARAEKMKIRAPFDGVVGLRMVSPGEYVNVGQKLASFESLNPMKLDFTLPEIDAPQVEQGMDISLTVDAYPNQSFGGTVYAIDPQINSSARSLALRASVPNNKKLLKPGYFATITLSLKPQDGAIMAPEASVVPKGSESFIYVVGEDGSVSLTPIEPGIRRDGKVEVRSGLKAGDVIVTAGQMKLQPGMKVTPQIADEKKEKQADTPDAK